jgi:iron(III) transport system permease protein
VVGLGAFLLQGAVVGYRSYVSGAREGRCRPADAAAAPVKIVAFSIAIPGRSCPSRSTRWRGRCLVRVWGPRLDADLSHFQRAFAIERAADGSLLFSGGAWHSLFTTIQLAAVAAPITAAIGLLAAWVLTRQRFAGRTALEFALMLTFAVPGTVIGVAYILTYNIPPLEITGTAMILIACFVFRNLPVGVRSGVAAMSQLDKSLDEAAVTLRASTFRALRTVVLPLLKPAIVTALVYSFVAR